ncbi:helix-turn-helix domain-containing protein [uncultured Sphingomonas sp.]|uniref:helix-turn-helix domain-containing protein n=1 Tax=uncultured Sphingomonas sp. TaxID=158754 RepID=UPI0035C9F298
MSCPHCGAPSEKTVTRGRWVVQTDPPQIFYDGAPLRLWPMHHRILTLLIRFGRISHRALEALSDVAETPVHKVHITLIRQKLPAGVSIQCVYGWGYELREAGAPADAAPASRASSS